MAHAAGRSTGLQSDLDQPDEAVDLRGVMDHLIAAETTIVLDAVVVDAHRVEPSEREAAVSEICVVVAGVDNDRTGLATQLVSRRLANPARAPRSWFTKKRSGSPMPAAQGGRPDATGS